MGCTHGLKYDASIQRRDCRLRKKESAATEKCEPLEINSKFAH